MPTSTASFDGEQYLYLTTRGRKTGRNREIEIWFTHHNGCFYVIAEYSTSNWVQNLQAESAVEVRVAQERFPARARVVPPETDSPLNQTIQELSRTKYGWGEGLVIELVPEQ